MNAWSHHFSDLSESGRVSGLHVVIVPLAAAAAASAKRPPREQGSREAAPLQQLAPRQVMMDRLLDGHGHLLETFPATLTPNATVR
jgi:hypothetical protein